MNKLVIPGRIIFAAGIMGLGILCFMFQDFIVGRPPVWPEGYDWNPFLAYASGGLVVLGSISVMLNIRPRLGALLIALLIFFLSILRHLPHFMNDWANAYKSLALFGGALILAGVTEDYKFKLSEKSKSILTIGGTYLLAVFFIACGYAHFKYAAFVETLIPAFIPLHTFWTYFCGVCLFAGGTGLIIPRTRIWAAFLSGVMVLGWFLLLHVPRFLANMSDASDRMGLCESFAFVGIFFVLAGQKTRTARTE